MMSSDEEHSGGKLLVRAEEALDARRIAEALLLFDQAEAIGDDPDACAAGRWQCFMLMGDYDRAWCESDAIERRGAPDPHRFWNGKPLAGEAVMLRCLHGLGDTIQFIRYAPLIRAQARRLIVEAQPSLKSLLHKANIADAVITWGEAEPPWTQQMEVNELPRIFRTSLPTIPNQCPYIHLPGMAVRQERSGSLRVGIVWRASEFNPLRSVPFCELIPLFRKRKVSFFSLQSGPACADLAAWSGQIANLCENSSSVLETADHMLRLDLVITVDTMTAHLAGALGIPVWTLVPFACDWRWMMGREDSPWYPGMRLFRQSTPGEWGPVIQRVGSSLNRLIAENQVVRPSNCVVRSR
jgi:hypothetical protein